MIKWNLQTLSIKDLKEHPKNPRQIDKDKFQHLDKLIAKFGLIDKPIVNKDLTIIGGHQRIKVLKKAKVKTVECWVAEEQLSDADVEELMIGVNKIQGKFDFDILANEFDAVDLLNWGFSEEELLGSCHDEIEGEEVEKKSKSKTKTCPSCGHEF